MRHHVLNAIEDGIRAIEFLKRSDSLDFIEASAQWMAECFKNGNKLLIAGNGGSLCDAMHFAEELTGIFRAKRKALPAIALSDPGHMTCTANDLGFDRIFARAIEAFGKPGDIFVSLTTSGNSPNLLEAVSVAKRIGLRTISFLGKTGGKFKGQSDLEWIVEGFVYSDRIQEAHMTAIHIIIEMIEKIMFQDEGLVPLEECLKGSF
ncbi:MAG TPA: SIS domain-containing protein [Rhabdochlamydiaceae bacterium]|nr:SIS domain-containing protein [Rhabdochlamydiaceae bacterium]